MSYVRTRLGRWFYEERGAPARASDPAIVLLHGFFFDGRMWKEQAAALAGLGRVIVIDGPGHGRSEAPPRFSLEDHADALLDVHAELKFAKAILIGLSWGGMVAMRMALQHPDKVKALGLLDTSAGREIPKNRVKYRLMVAFTRRYGIPPRMIEREMLPQFFGPTYAREHREEALAYMRAGAGFDRDGVARAALAVLIKRGSVEERLGRIGAPSLVLCGADDAATPPFRSEAIARSIPGSKYVVIQGAGHMSAIEAPQAVNAQLVPFVREQLG
jgi:pimeloyl-ACP methyl ester carboxylesterase